jgi:uncharacterized protein
MKTLEEIKQWLVLNKSALEERYGVKEIGIFGSYVRQEQTEASDVDVHRYRNHLESSPK